jgi:hypothetical protein
MVPNGVIYNTTIGYKADWDYNMDISLVSRWLSSPLHKVKTVIINTGPHYNTIQFGGGVELSAIQEIYRTAMEYIATTLADTLRPSQIAFFRASTSGHSNGRGICSATQPLRETVRIKYFDFNWHGQETYNAIWKVFLEEKHLQRKWENIRYLDISRPTMLRPDAVHPLMRYSVPYSFLLSFFLSCVLARLMVA